MKRSPDPGAIDELPPSLRSLWRTFQFGYRAEPRLLTMSLVMVLFTALPDGLVALWLKLLADGVQDRDRAVVIGAALGLGVSATLTWYLSVVFDRLQRYFRDRLSIALEARVAELQASIATIEHHERPDYLDRLQVLRDQVFALEHLFSSVFTTLGWALRLAITLVLLMSIHPALGLLIVFALPTLLVASWRPAVERVIEEKAAPERRLARHLFVLGTDAAPGKEVRVARIGELLAARREAAWTRWYAPVARARWISALWHALAWGVFGAAFCGAVLFVAVGLRASAGTVLLVLVAAGRLSQYVGAVVGELGFLRGIWLYSARRLIWLEDYAAASSAHQNATVPAQLQQGIQLDRVSFRYPGTQKLVLEDVTVELPAGAVIAIVGENGAGKSTLVKLLCGMYAPTSGRILVDGVSLGTLPIVRWREQLAGAFQDFFRFEFLAQRSVGVGEVARADERPAVETAVVRAGAGDVITRLGAGLDTQLGTTWDGGVDLSFGQWQKLALARGLMRDAPLLLVLDEPTAALDAETEHALFERFAAASRETVANGRITILVSHRFSTVRMADRIVVLDGARVVEVGSHEELIAMHGQYAELFAIQAAAFR
jgi:ATP-binding cassette, subfamily B, bacterial